MGSDQQKSEISRLNLENSKLRDEIKRISSLTTSRAKTPTGFQPTSNLIRSEAIQSLPGSINSNVGQDITDGWNNKPIGNNSPFKGILFLKNLKKK